MENDQIKKISEGDIEFPNCLRAIPSRPKQIYYRGNIGIASPIAQAKKIAADKYVLKKILAADRAPFDQAIGTVISALSFALSDGVEKSMTEFNQ